MAGQADRGMTQNLPLPPSFFTMNWPMWTPPTKQWPTSRTFGTVNKERKRNHICMLRTCQIKGVNFISLCNYTVSEEIFNWCAFKIHILFLFINLKRDSAWFYYYWYLDWPLHQIWWRRQSKYQAKPNLYKDWFCISKQCL